MLLLIDFARITIEDNECVVLYFEPVRTSFFFLFYQIQLTKQLKNILYIHLNENEDSKE
jgi:hypothetical protein